MTVKLGKWMRQKRTKSRKYPGRENTGRKIGNPALRITTNIAEKITKIFKHTKMEVACRTDSNIRQHLREHENTRPCVCFGLCHHA